MRCVFAWCRPRLEETGMGFTRFLFNTQQPWRATKVTFAGFEFFHPAQHDRTRTPFHTAIWPPEKEDGVEAPDTYM